MSKTIAIVQASSRTWAGGTDRCMRMIDGEPALRLTMRKILCLPNDVVLAMPDSDPMDVSSWKKVLGLSAVGVRIYQGDPSSPLRRILYACAHLDDDDYIVRIDGMHVCFDDALAVQMLAFARERKLDCVKPPDDFPTALSSDIYRVGALRKALYLLDEEKDHPFHVHPKYFMFSSGFFRCEHYYGFPNYSNAVLDEWREKCRPLYELGRDDVVETDYIEAGDMLSFHYELARRWLKPEMVVLDAACAAGFGTRAVSEFVREIRGVDIDITMIANARRLPNRSNTSFHVCDVTRMNFYNDRFDAVLSMETIEHVDEIKFMNETRRVLKPGGLFILSTPQNSLGWIPINCSHKWEYSLEEIIVLCRRYYEVIEIMGIKAGRVVIPGDHRGTNTFVVCRKKKETPNGLR